MTGQSYDIVSSCMKEIEDIKFLIFSLYIVIAVANLNFQGHLANTW
jgi:hypothetical protein